MNIEIDITKLSLEKAKEFYVECWGRLLILLPDSDEYIYAFDMVIALEEEFNFPQEYIRKVWTQSHKEAGTQKTQGVCNG